jgi:hypothetical protein
MDNIGRNALVRNRALDPFSLLIGLWRTVGSHPLLPNQELRGKASFEWTEGGAFLKVHTEMDHTDIPAGVAIIGSDDSANKFSMIYFDERGVSRHYQVSIEGRTLKWWRDFPDFSQRFTCVISEDGNSMTGKGDLSKDGTHWEGDLNLTYTREDR